jgi:hypothetical protein
MRNREKDVVGSIEGQLRLASSRRDVLRPAGTRMGPKWFPPVPVVVLLRDPVLVGDLWFGVVGPVAAAVTCDYQ